MRSILVFAVFALLMAGAQADVNIGSVNAYTVNVGDVNTDMRINNMVADSINSGNHVGNITIESATVFEWQGKNVQGNISIGEMKLGYMAMGDIEGDVNFGNITAHNQAGSPSVKLGTVKGDIVGNGIGGFEAISVAGIVDPAANSTA